MKFVATLSIVLATAVATQAGEPVSSSSLKSIGLSNLRPMTDVQGHEVRAKFAVVFGTGTATAWSGFTSATSTNGYTASGFGGHSGVNVSGAFANGSGFFAGPAYAVSGGFSAAR
ncbi:hypothetical protein [Planctellipticum variicoloris]|uniref:hypothetical protein n=1 Tax=Planctellipticum variicoloris TaxID=3064265 RepID=UPI00301360D4|nr:hypothetical protein SH412_002628 [Planctomycetaceae bacterium SH412]